MCYLLVKSRQCPHSALARPDTSAGCSFEPYGPMATIGLCRRQFFILTAAGLGATDEELHAPSGVLAALITQSH